MTLHVRGWEADQIDLAAESICEACSDGMFEGSEILELSDDEVERVLDDEFPEDEIEALLVVADLRAQSTRDSERLSRALYDLDAFAYEYGDED